MNIYKLKKRYRKSNEEIAQALSQNLDKLGCYAKFQYGAWEVDEKGLPLLDQLFGYHVPKATSEPAKPLVEEEASASVVQQLKEELEDAQSMVQQYETELNTLQEKFISMQNGSGAMNSSLIRKHQLRAEAAEAQLVKVQKDFAEKERLKSERISELETRIEEMQGKLVENHDEMERKQKELFEANEKIEALKKESTERCSQAELRVLNSKKSEDKLYKDLHANEVCISELNQKLANANNDRTEAMRQMNDMRTQMTDLKSQLISMVSHLNNYLTDAETIQDAAGKTVEPQDPASLEASAEEVDAKADTAVEAKQPERLLPETTIDNERNELMEKLRKEQAKEKEEPPQGFFHKIFKAAGIF